MAPASEYKSYHSHTKGVGRGKLVYSPATAVFVIAQLQNRHLFRLRIFLLSPEVTANFAFFGGGTKFNNIFDRFQKTYDS